VSTNALLERTVAEREQLVTLIEGVTTAAFQAERDLSDQDHDTINRAQDRIAFLDKQADRLSFDTAIGERTRNALATNGVSAGSLPSSYRSAGEALFDLLHMDRKESRQRLEQEMHRAAQHMGTSAASTVPVAGGLGALVVRPVVGPVIDSTPGGRPFLTALGVIPLDTPLGFSRPRVVDPVTRPGSASFGEAPATQAQEKAELVSRAFDIKLDPIDTETIGEYLNISQKLLALPIPSLQIILNQFAKRRAIKTERRAIAEIMGSTSAVDLALVPAADQTDGENVWRATWEAAAEVYKQTGELPQWLVMGPEGWQRIGQLLDKAGRPLFPGVGNAVNAMGSADATSFTVQGPAGLRAIVTHAITGPELIVGNASGLEAYEYSYPMLEAIEPSVLGKQVAVASELAFYRPATTDAGGDGNGAVVIAPPAPAGP
jgi:HK97 family phage major capsid protein